MNVVAPLSVGNERFRALRFDTLVWNLEGLPKVQHFVVDITLVLQSESDSLKSIQLVVPFAVDRIKDIESLNHQLVDRELAMPCAVAVSVDEGTADYLLPQAETIHTSSFEVREPSVHDRPKGVLSRISRRSPAWSVITLDLDTSLAKDELALVRVRCRVFGKCGFVLWKRSGFGLNGALLEASTALTLAAASTRLKQTLRDHAAPITASSIAFVLRASFQLQLGYPDIRPTIVEGSAWEPYLDPSNRPSKRRGTCRVPHHGRRERR